MTLSVGRSVSRLVSRSWFPKEFHFLSRHVLHDLYWFTFVSLGFTVCHITIKILMTAVNIVKLIFKTSWFCVHPSSSICSRTIYYRLFISAFLEYLPAVLSCGRVGGSVASFCFTGAAEVCPGIQTMLSFCFQITVFLLLLSIVCCCCCCWWCCCWWVNNIFR